MKPLTIFLIVCALMGSGCANTVSSSEEVTVISLTSNVARKINLQGNCGWTFDGVEDASHMLGMNNFKEGIAEAPKRERERFRKLVQSAYDESRGKNVSVKVVLERTALWKILSVLDEEKGV